MSGLSKTDARARARRPCMESAEEAKKIEAGRFSIIPRPTLPEAGKQRILFPIGSPKYG
jgi:hypothetical protein